MKPLLFIWIPKTAGTSVFYALSKTHGMDILMSDYPEWDNVGNITFGHLDVLMLLDLKVISKEYWDSAQKFTIVRNPFSRFISLYHDFMRTARIAPDVTPLRFAQACLNSVRKPGLYNAYGFSQCASQVKWILPGVDIYRFEDLEKIESSLSIKLSHENNGNVDDWEQFYDSELKKMVIDLYYSDFILLNYGI